jgi:hypothetical protein
LGGISLFLPTALNQLHPLKKAKQLEVSAVPCALSALARPSPQTAAPFVTSISQLRTLQNELRMLRRKVSRPHVNEVCPMIGRGIANVS